MDTMIATERADHLSWFYDLLVNLEQRLSGTRTLSHSTDRTLTRMRDILGVEIPQCLRQPRPHNGQNPMRDCPVPEQLSPHSELAFGDVECFGLLHPLLHGRKRSEGS